MPTESKLIERDELSTQEIVEGTRVLRDALVLALSRIDERRPVFGYAASLGWLQEVDEPDEQSVRRLRALPERVREQLHLFVIEAASRLAREAMTAPSTVRDGSIPGESLWDTIANERNVDRRRAEATRELLLQLRVTIDEALLALSEAERLRG